MIRMVPLTHQKWENFTPYLLLHLSDLEQEQVGFSIESRDNEYITIRGYSLATGNESVIEPEEVESLLHKAFCTAISSFIVEELEEEIITSMIAEEFGFELSEHIEAIYNYCFDMLFLNEEHQFRDEAKISERKKHIMEKAYAYVQEQKEFHVDGFIRFRLTDYKYNLKELIEYAIDEYIVDKEYQEFIQLLRYYVAQQVPKVPLIHALHISDKQFKLFNQQGEQLTEQQIETYLQKWALESISHDDLIVSTLIAMAPQRIVIHTSHEHLTVIRTLKSIFQDQLEICLTCENCKQWQKKQVLLKR